MNFNDFALIPKADYKDACDAIREKTGETDSIVSGEMGGLIRSITTGGAELTIVATTKSGATVTATKGDLSVSAVAVDGVATLKVPEGGTWVVVATLNGYSSEEMAVEVITAFSTELELELDEIYGAEWDGTSNPAWSRTDKAASFTDPVPYVAGATEYGSPFDNIMPWAGIEIVEDAEAGTLVKIPKFWFKWTRNGAATKLQISPKAVDGFFVSPAHADRGDGKGERDVVYVGRYCCGSAYKSVTGQTPKANMTRATARTNIAALGDTIWQFDYAMMTTIRMLYLVEFAHWDSQAKIGYGCGVGNTIKPVGSSDSMPYHTGTVQTSRTVYGMGCQYRYIEGLWDNIYYWCDGIVVSGNTVYGIPNPADFKDSVGGIELGTLPTAGVPSEWAEPSSEEVRGWLYPTATNGTDAAIYTCDRVDRYLSGPVVLMGASYGQGLHYGLFYHDIYVVNSVYDNSGCRLMKLP